MIRNANHGQKPKTRKLVGDNILLQRHQLQLRKQNEGLRKFTFIQQVQTYHMTENRGKESGRRIRMPVQDRDSSG
jgi:hypothetical protein